ncbi:hypothetical protein ACT3S8_15415 [Halomonas sp. AOP42-D2-25]|uniref:hypothetical protein n=1 Tax=Halomonas sp. AOP42-D2-25 TaxID=3457666 RepID=UPI004033275B
MPVRPHHSFFILVKIKKRSYLPAQEAHASQVFSPDEVAIIIPLSILFAALLLFGTGLTWARYRDLQNQEHLEW